MRRVIDYINFKFLVVLFFFLNNQFVAAQELNSDTTSISTTPLVEESSLMWRDLRNVRDSMRSEMRDTRDELRDEISNMRDELRKEIYATVDSLPHELRIGWGDQIFESIVWRSGLYPTVLPEDYTIVNNENFRYIQHYYVEYQYIAVKFTLLNEEKVERFNDITLHTYYKVADSIFIIYSRLNKRFKIED